MTKGGGDLDQVPPDLDETFSSVLEAQAGLIQSAAQLGVVHSFEQGPKAMLDQFYKLGDVNATFAQYAADAPAVKQAEAKLEAAQRDLAQAELNLSYCDITAKIDGVVTSRNVNPGDFVQVGQNLLAIRSLNEIWVDANFKETQLRDLRIGQTVQLYVDMYGGRTCSEAGSPASPRAPDRPLRCCHRRMLLAILSRWSSGCRSGSISSIIIPIRHLCSSARRWFRTSKSISRPPDPMQGSFSRPMCRNLTGPGLTASASGARQ